MNQLSFSIEEQNDLRTHNIQALILFGSRAQEINRDDSDYDIGVIGPNSTTSYDLLYTLLSEKINQLVNVDIVFLSDAPMELQSHVAKYGIVLYQQKPVTFANFREQVMRMYADFAPLRRLFQQATLERISPWQRFL